MAKISVVVPVYKVEKYLRRCVESILSQTYENLEVILVDDGSPDLCGAICDEYSAKDTRVKVIHKQNGGLSSARNAGIAAATGDYIGFIDSDDYILPQMYERLLAALEENSADISICNYAYVEEDTDAILPSNSPLKTEVLTTEQALRKLDASADGYSFYITAWNRLYKKGIFDLLRFPDGRIHEDEFVAHKVFNCCTRIAIIDTPLYMYVQRRGSITNNGIHVKALDGVYALYDRGLFFWRKGYCRLARNTLLAAEWKLRSSLAGLSQSDSKAAWKAVRKLLPALLVSACPEFIHLMIAWFKYCHRRKA